MYVLEQIKTPAIGFLRAMVGVIIINGCLGFGFLLALLFYMGDADMTLNPLTGFPVIQIIYNITGSLHAISAMMPAIAVKARLSIIPLSHQL